MMHIMYLGLFHMALWSYIYIYIYICMYVCMYVYVTTCSMNLPFHIVSLHFAGRTSGTWIILTNTSMNVIYM
jgi:hypothetical protein